MDQELTFYIASSGKNMDAVRDFADELMDRGWSWHHGWDWTQCYGEHESYAHTLLDKICAIECDVFIFLDSKHFTVGGQREWGARWGSGGAVINITDKPHLFDNDPLVATYESTEEMLEDLFDGE